MLRKIYFASSITAIYIVTLGSIGALLYSSQLLGVAAWATPVAETTYQKPVVSKPQTISGKPNRIVIVDRNIDLAVNDGTYDRESRSWTLSDTNAQFAIASSLANDQMGTTFIYGHGTDAVFGKIGSNPPPIGTTAQLFTENGRVFSYQLADVQNLKPTDTWILRDTHTGNPRLIVQTCTGAFSEWRTMFIFSFKEVSS
jgi:hypothetical protein